MVDPGKGSLRYPLFPSSHWLVASPEGFDLCTDHRNIVFIFDPLSLKPDLSQSSIKQVMRWAVLMNMYNYVCIHVPGVDNVWADLLGRWSAPITIRRILSVPPLASSQGDSFDWPTAEELRVLQKEHVVNLPDGLSIDDGSGLGTRCSGRLSAPHMNRRSYRTGWTPRMRRNYRRHPQALLLDHTAFGHPDFREGMHSLPVDGWWEQGTSPAWNIGSRYKIERSASVRLHRNGSYHHG